MCFSLWHGAGCQFRRPQVLNCQSCFRNRANGHIPKPPSGGSLLAVRYLASSPACLALNRFSAQVWARMASCKMEALSLKWRSAALWDGVGKKHGGSELGALYANHQSSPGLESLWGHSHPPWHHAHPAIGFPCLRVKYLGL